MTTRRPPAAWLQVFHARVLVGPQGLIPGAITELPGLPAATLSFHPKELMQAGLVSRERSMPVEVPVMLPLVAIADRTRHWCPAAGS